MNPPSRDNHQVWVWAEHYRNELAKVSLGLLGKAQELRHQLGGGEVAAILVGSNSQQLADELVTYGADKVYLAGGPSLTLFDTGLCARFMSKLIQSHRPEIVLWGATSLGRETASRAAAKLATGLTAHCIDLYIEEIQGKPQLVSVVAGWGSNLTLKIICPQKRPQMATVKPGIFPPLEPKKRSGEIVPVQVEDKASSLEIVEIVEEREETASLEQAEIVVAGGWGLNSLSGFQAVEELAQVLGGSIAGTRPAVDAGWITTGRMIGQSGKTIAPKLLITLGVSGAPQFATGVLNSKFILAVDKNPRAPIFEMADMGIVGDLRDILPPLISKLKAAKGKT